ncbi:MAG: ethylbenzene dehydrogenase-related protein [Chloroflexota bacterium]
MTWRPILRFHTLAPASVALAAFLALAGVPITSAQGPILFTAHLNGVLPVDAPFDPAWDGVRPVDVALSGQPVVPPMLLDPAFPSVRVRAVENGEQFAVLLEWSDPTLDDSVLAVDSFADAAAMQVALGTGTSICMGQQAGALNIWHWKADWAADLAGRRNLEDVHPEMPTDEHFPATDDLGPDGFLTGTQAGNTRSATTLASSVEDLNAVGFGSLTPQPSDRQNVHGASEYRADVWRVVMSRDLLTSDPNDAVLRPGDAAAVVAFALWDGSRGDRDGQKSVSTWLSFVVSQPAADLSDTWPFLVMVLLVIAMSGLLMYYGARQPAIGLGGPGARMEHQDGG